MFTEAEATDHWCPMVRVAHPVAGTSVNTWGLGRNGKAHCEGSSCMMWRWQHREETGPGAKGFCGLAGRPA